MDVRVSPDGRGAPVGGRAGREFAGFGVPELALGERDLGTALPGVGRVVIVQSEVISYGE